MNLKQREQLLALAAIFCLVALLGDKLVVSPLLTAWEKRSARIIQLNSSLSEGHSLVAREEVLTEMWDNMKQRSLPTEVSAAENQVFKSVSRWTRDSRLSMTSLKPRWTQDEDEFRMVEFRATAQGSMASITRFLYELECDPLPLRVEEIEISARDDSGNKLTLDVRFTGLLLTEKEE